MKSKVLILVVILAVLVIGGYKLFLSKSENEKVVVKFGHITGTILNLPEDILKKSDILTKAGVSVEFVDFASSNLLYEAAVRGDIDMSSLVSVLPVFINNNKQPGAIKVFASGDLTIEDKYDSILVKKDSPIILLSDLSGKKLKYGVFPGSTHMALTKKYLQDQGIDISAIEFISLPPQNHLQSLEVGAIDVLGTYDPTATAAIASGNYRRIGYSVYANTYNHAPIGVGIINAKFLSAHVDVAKKVAKAYQAAYDLMNSDKENSYNVISSVFSLSPEVARQVPIPVYASQIKVDKENIQKFADFLYGVKEVPEKVNASQFVVSLK